MFQPYFMVMPCAPQIILPVTPTHFINSSQLPLYNVVINEHHRYDTSQQTIEKQQKFLERKKADEERKIKKIEKLQDIERKKHKKILMEARRNDHDESEDAPVCRNRRVEK